MRRKTFAHNENQFSIIHSGRARESISFVDRSISEVEKVFNFQQFISSAGAEEIFTFWKERKSECQHSAIQYAI